MVSCLGGCDDGIGLGVWFLCCVPMIYECVCDEPGVRNCGIHSPIQELELEVKELKSRLKEMTGYRDKWKSDCIKAEDKLIALRDFFSKAIADSKKEPDVVYELAEKHIIEGEQE